MLRNSRHSTSTQPLKHSDYTNYLHTPSDLDGPLLSAAGGSTAKKSEGEYLTEGSEEDERYVSTYSLPTPRGTPRRAASRIFEKRYQSLGDYFADFCQRTSAHGIPHVSESGTYVGKFIWAVIFLGCSIAFGIQTYLTVNKYLQYNTIYEMELKFEPAEFPAVTVCNLNPYKYSLVVDQEDIARLLEQFNLRQKARGAPNQGYKIGNRINEVVNYENTRGKQDDDFRQRILRNTELQSIRYGEQLKLQYEYLMKNQRNNRADLKHFKDLDGRIKSKRQSYQETFLPPRESYLPDSPRITAYNPDTQTDEEVTIPPPPETKEYSLIMAQCSCVPAGCTALAKNSTDPERNIGLCMCIIDLNIRSLWPCYLLEFWTKEQCRNCSHVRTCLKPTVSNEVFTQEPQSCYCQNISGLCVMDPGRIPRWNPTKPDAIPVTLPPTTTPRPTLDSGKQEAMGLDNLDNSGSITNKAKEGIILGMAQMDKEKRMTYSYSMDEFVFSCTFNMGDCDMTKDFKLQVDPAFGNCYSFNANTTEKLKNSRAGPMFGLRLLLNVNQSDYLPTTEAAGVRLLVHERDDEPFPDTFGYSAPVGVISSFGLKTKKLTRLRPPHGTCKMDHRPEGYIYEEYYSVEGCYRSCFQHYIIGRCKCGDPRFPVPHGKRGCAAFNMTERACLENATKELGGNYYNIQKETKTCFCPQPCEEMIYETAYSASAWPALSYQTGECPPEIESNDTALCTEYFRQNTAFVEIYYEQLNFESLKQTEAYTIVNLLSDFGGNIGLWIGFSIITFIELFELLFELCYFCYYRRKRRRSQKKKRKQKNIELTYMNRVVGSTSPNRPNPSINIRHPSTPGTTGNLSVPRIRSSHTNLTELEPGTP